MSVSDRKAFKPYYGLHPNDRPLRKYRHVAMKQTFEELGDGLVKVTADDGRTGVFQWRGPHVEGELTQANVHMLVWTGGPDLPDDCRFHWIETPIDVDRPSGWPEEYEKRLPYVIGRSA